MLTRTAGSEPFVSVAEAKPHCNVDSSDDDDLIKTYIAAATARFETRTGRILASGQFEYTFDGWSDCLLIPVAPVRTVTEVAYLDTDGTEQTLADADWYEGIGDRDAYVGFVSGFSAPTLSSDTPKVIVRFEAGYDVPDASGSGDDPALERNPMDVVAVLMLTAHWFNHREAAGPESMASVPGGFEDLVNERRIYR